MSICLKEEKGMRPPATKFKVSEVRGGFTTDSDDGKPGAVSGRFASSENEARAGSTRNSTGRSQFKSGEVEGKETGSLRPGAVRGRGAKGLNPVGATRGRV